MPLRDWSDLEENDLLSTFVGEKILSSPLFPWKANGVSDAKGRLGLRGAVVTLGMYLVCLSGCRIGAKVESKADGGQYTEIVFEDTTDSMRTLKSNCEELREYFGTTARYAAAAKMEDVTVPGDCIRCKMTSNMPRDEVTVKDNAGTLSTSMKPSLPDGADLDGLTMTTTITMPGKVIRSSIGKIRGNKVVIDGYDYPIAGFTITSHKNNSDGPTAHQSTKGVAASTNRHGIHAASLPWIRTDIGCTTLAVLTPGGLTTFRTARKRKQHTAQAASSSRPETVSAPPPSGSPS